MRNRKGEKSTTQLFREMLEVNPAISGREAVDQLRKQHGRTGHVQTFYSAKYAINKKSKKDKPVGIARKRKQKKQRLAAPPIAETNNFEIEFLRRENRKLKDALMRFMLDE